MLPVGILAGGFGSRISEETANKPKPMVLLGDKPILEHLINIFQGQGFKEFYLTVGYKSEVIKEWNEKQIGRAHV